MLGMFGRKKRGEDAEEDVDRRASSSDTAVHDADNEDSTNPWNDYHPSKAQIKRATRTRYIWSLICSALFLIAFVFLILVNIGNTRLNPTLNDIYFIRLNLANIIPVSVPQATLINSIAQSLGLHDFYTVGMWNFCEGYLGQGTTQCSNPETLYWFDPVSILRSELLAGATIALPADINDILRLLRIASRVMFGFFLTGTILTFIMMFLFPLTVFGRWKALPITIFTFITALLNVVATVVATVIFIVMQGAITSATSLNITANLGVKMFAFMWIAASCSLIAFIIQLGQCCCCASRRDVRTGRKRGSKKAWTGAGGDEAPMKEKQRQPGMLGRFRK